MWELRRQTILTRPFSSTTTKPLGERLDGLPIASELKLSTSFYFSRVNVGKETKNSEDFCVATCLNENSANSLMKSDEILPETGVESSLRSIS